MEELHIPNQQVCRLSASLSPGLSVSKSARETSYSAVGQSLTYTIVLSNTGNVTLTSILVTDPLTGLSRSVSSLAPGASNTITENYTITQDDLNRGYVDNTATASCNFGGSTLSDRASIRVTGSQNPRLTISKSARETNFTCSR